VVQRLFKEFKEFKEFKGFKVFNVVQIGSNWFKMDEAILVNR
jgi:hypothetical protein